MLRHVPVEDSAETTPPGLVSQVLEPVLYWLDNIGNTISLTGQSLLWLFRPPFRVSQNKNMT